MRGVWNAEHARLRKGRQLQSMEGENDLILAECDSSDPCSLPRTRVQFSLPNNAHLRIIHGMMRHRRQCDPTVLFVAELCLESTTAAWHAAKGYTTLYSVSPPRFSEAQNDEV